MKSNKRPLKNAVRKRIATSTAKFLSWQLKSYGKTRIRIYEGSYHSHKRRAFPNIGIIFQGPILNSKDIEFLSESIESALQIVPIENIVVSTWNSTQIEAIRRQLPCEVIVNQDNESLGNHERQLISTSSAIEKLKLNGRVEFMVKMRVDQRFDFEPLFANCLTLLATFGKKRVVFASNNSFKYRPFGLSDMFTFANRESSEIFWHCKSNEVYNLRNLQINEKFAPWHSTENTFWTESFLNIRFASYCGFEFGPSVWDDSLRYMGQHTVLIDSDYFGHDWTKLPSVFVGSTEKMLFNRHRPELLQEWNFNDWWRIMNGDFETQTPKEIF